MQNQELKEQLVECLREDYGIEITEGQAEEYLNSLADFFLAFVDD